MPRILFTFWLTAVCCLTCFECQADRDFISPVLIFQLRVPKSVSPNPKTTRVNLATPTGEDSGFLWGYNQKAQKVVGDDLIFEPDEFLLDTEPEGRRALYIDDFTNPAQVFRLSLPRSPKVRGWSQWQRPDFLAREDFGWAFIYNRKIQLVTTNPPLDCFELRYKVEMRNFGSGVDGPSLKH